MKYLYFGLFLFSCFPAEAFTATSVSQYGITWYFSSDRTVGRFANGDYWVLGPVTIDSITPHFNGAGYGWEVNPAVDGDQGFQDGCYGGGFDAGLVPDLPYTSPASEIVSIVKTTPSGDDRPCIQLAAVLTVLTGIPADSGTTLFRPPYVGTDKPLYSTGNLRTGLLPGYEPTDSVTALQPSLADVESWFRKLRLDHKRGNLGRALRPADAMDDYQPANTPLINSAALCFMLDHGTEDMTPALVQYIQAGIDKIHTIFDGQTWPDGGGHQPGHIMASAFTAVMLDIQAAKDTLVNASFFHGSRFIQGSTADGNALWGETSSETGYWNYVMDNGGDRSQVDPYGYIDGGKNGVEYQLVTSPGHKGEVLALHMMPVLREAWPAADLALVPDYADRWVNLGIWSQPDPCAPYDAGGTYGVDFGPDPSDPGMCIRDKDLEYYNGPDDFNCRAGAECGRYPQKHGTRKDGGSYISSFVNAVWDAYRGPSCYDGVCDSGETCEYDCGTTGITTGSASGRKSPGFRILISPPLLHEGSSPVLIRWYGPEFRSPALVIYNGRGKNIRIVKTIGNSAVWHGLDKDGKRVAPGLYYLRATGSGNTAMGKIAVIR